MKTIICMLLIVLSLNVVAQKVEIPTSPPEKKVLVADETEVVKSGEKKFRIITSNDQISEKVLTKFKQTVLVSFSGSKRAVSFRGKKETFWETSYYFFLEDYNNVMAFIKGGFK